MADAIWSLLRDLESQTRHSFEKPCWSRSLKDLGTSGRLGLEGLLLTHVSQLIVQWIDYSLEGGREVFRRVLRFLFDNTSSCYLVFVFFFPTLLLFILLLCFNVYRLEQLVCLSACIYTISHLELSQCKIYRAVTLIWGSKQALVFSTHFRAFTIKENPLYFQNHVKSIPNSSLNKSNPSQNTKIVSWG